MTLEEHLKAEGFDTESEAFKRAMRKFNNPEGCEFCGANSRVANINAKGEAILACCKRNMSKEKK